MATNFDPNEEPGINDINITPFVDVVLVLLVIFMVTAPIMVKESMNIQLPKSKSTDQVAVKTLSVGISKTGQILLNGDLIDLTLLYNKALSHKKENSNVQVIINADRQSVHGDVIKVLDQVRLAGITNFAFQVEKLTDD
jgi:biopolymer transport protein ExbD